MSNVDKNVEKKMSLLFLKMLKGNSLMKIKSSKKSLVFHLKKYLDFWMWMEDSSLI